MFVEKKTFFGFFRCTKTSESIQGYGLNFQECHNVVKENDRIMFKSSKAKKRLQEIRAQAEKLWLCIAGNNFHFIAMILARYNDDLPTQVNQSFVWIQITLLLKFITSYPRMKSF